MKPFGYHLLIDLYDCRYTDWTNKKRIKDFLRLMTKELCMKPLSEPFVVRADDEKYPDLVGFSAWIPIIESGIQIHAVESKKFISIDVYSCKEFESDEILNLIKEEYKPKLIEKELLLRGKKYGN